MIFKIKKPKKINMVSTVGIMMAITFSGKLMGILRDRMQGYYFGTYSAEAIAFSQAAFLPRNFLDIMFASVFSASFIPVFNRYLETKGQRAAFDLAARFIRLLLLITLAITILAIIFAEPIYTIFLNAEAQAPEVRTLGIDLLRIMFPIMVISSLAFAITGILQSMGQFNIPAAMSVASNGIILLYYFFFIDRFGVYGLALSFLIGWSAQLLIQVPFLFRIGFRFFGPFRPWGSAPHPARDSSLDPSFDTSSSSSSSSLSSSSSSLSYSSSSSSSSSSFFREIGGLALPVMLASWLVPFNLLVNTRASGNLYGGEHGFPALIYAHNLFTVITGLFVLSLANVLFPTLAKLAAHRDWKEYALFLRNSLQGMLFLLLPMSFGLMALSRPLVRLVYQTGRFNELSVEITATALFFFSFGIVGFGLQVILSRACFAMQDGRGPLVTALLAMAVNLLLSFALAPSMEIGGPALASSVAITVAGFGLLFRLRRRLPEAIWTAKMSIDIAKMFFLALLMYLLVSFALSLLGLAFTDDTFLARLLKLLLPAGFGALIYFIGALILKVPEAKIALGWLLGKMEGAKRVRQL